MATTLPNDLLYMVNTISGYTTNVFRLQTLSTNKLASNGSQQCTVSLPVTGIANLKSFAMHADVRTYGIPAPAAAPGSAVFALLPKMSDLIDRYGVAVGGVALDNQCSHINMIKTLKDNLYKSTTKFMSDDRVLDNATFTPIDPSDPWAGTHKGQNKHLVKNQWPGFFSESEPSYLDLSKVPEVRMTLQLANRSVLPVQFEGAVLGSNTPIVENTNFTNNCEFDLDSIYFTIEMISINGGMLEELNSRIISERGQLDIPFKQYNIFTTDSNSANNSLRASVSTMSLDRLYGVQRNTTNTVDPAGPKYISYNSQQAPVPVPDNVSFSHTLANNTFISDGVGNYRFTVNNQPFPQYDPSPVDGFHLMVSGAKRTCSKDRGCLVGSQGAWRENCYASVLTLNHSDDVRLVSGMNLSSINAQIAYDTLLGSNAVGNSYGRQQIIVSEQTSLLRVSAGRSVSVIA
jgi:hypothetical protein